MPREDFAEECERTDVETAVEPAMRRGHDYAQPAGFTESANNSTAAAVDVVMINQ
jgi:hypothetical protein